jgi:hypothetical protein
MSFCRSLRPGGLDTLFLTLPGIVAGSAPASGLEQLELTAIDFFIIYLPLVLYLILDRVLVAMLTYGVYEVSLRPKLSSP